MMKGCYAECPVDVKQTDAGDALHVWLAPTNAPLRGTMDYRRMPELATCSVSWMQPGGQDVSVLDDMLTVSPNMQKRRRTLPTMPVTTGPLCMPEEWVQSHDKAGLCLGVSRIKRV